MKPYIRGTRTLTSQDAITGQVSVYMVLTTSANGEPAKLVQVGMKR